MKERYRFLGRGGIQNHEYLMWVGGPHPRVILYYDLKWFYDQMIGRKVTE